MDLRASMKAVFIGGIAFLAVVALAVILMQVWFALQTRTLESRAESEQVAEAVTGYAFYSAQHLVKPADMRYGRSRSAFVLDQWDSTGVYAGLKWPALDAEWRFDASSSDAAACEPVPRPRTPRPGPTPTPTPTPKTPPPPPTPTPAPGLSLCAYKVIATAMPLGNPDVIDNFPLLTWDEQFSKQSHGLIVDGVRFEVLVSATHKVVEGGKVQTLTWTHTPTPPPTPVPTPKT